MSGEWQFDSATNASYGNGYHPHPQYNFEYFKPPPSPNATPRSNAGSTVPADPLMPEKEEAANSNEDETGIIRSRRIPAEPLLIVAKNVYSLDASSCSIAKLIVHIKAISIGLSSTENYPANATSEGATPKLDFICDALIKIYDRNSQRPGSPASQLGGGWKLCHHLKHYKQTTVRQRGATLASDFQILNFNDRPFNVAHLPADIPADSAMSDMKLEVNRLKSFSLVGRPAFLDRCGTGQTPEELAACGFFYMQEADKVKCAFCLGVLFNWELGEDVQAGHRLRYSTCPLLLGLDVGNVPMEKRQERSLRLSQACTEEPQGASWEASLEPLSLEQPQQYQQLAFRPHPPVSSATASAACRPGVTDNLEVLARAARSPQAAASCYPMKHPAWRSCQDREASLTRASQQLPVPGALLAAAGFFQDAAGLPTACHWCGLQVLHWLEADDPWVEHARWSPRCCHLLLARGPEFVLLSRQSHPPYPVEKLQRPLGASQELPGSDDFDSQAFARGSSPLIDYRIEPRYFKAREDCPATLALQQRLGCDPDDARTALFLQLKGSGDDFRSGEQFLQSALSQLARRQVRGSSAREFFEQSQRDQELLLAREPRPFEEDEIDWRACKVCMDKVINVTLLDCKHLCCCSACAKHLDTCPLCRAPIRATMIVNMD